MTPEEKARKIIERGLKPFQAISTKGDAELPLTDNCIRIYLVPQEEGLRAPPQGDILNLIHAQAFGVKCQMPDEKRKPGVRPEFTVGKAITRDRLLTSPAMTAEKLVEAIILVWGIGGPDEATVDTNGKITARSSDNTRNDGNRHEGGGR